jgi:hypothetical protein
MMKVEKERAGSAGRAALVSAICAICLLSTGSVSAEGDPISIGDTRATIEKWVETQRIISKEKRDLAVAKEILSERIELVEREIEALRGKITKAEENIAEADKKRMEMIEENEKLQETSAALESVVRSLENRTGELLKRLPAPIRKRVKPLSQQLPEDSEETKLSLSRRFQNVVGILNELNKFDREITVVSEVRTLPDGSSAQVKAMYLGIGQGYYTDQDGIVAGVGAPSDEGWIWTPANESAREISRAIAILNNEQVADFVHLPVDIR